jgi:hypothetical protein
MRFAQLFDRPDQPGHTQRVAREPVGVLTT